MASRAALKNAAHTKRRRENAMVASELVDRAMMPLDNDDGECTITDLAAGEDGPGEMAVESIDEDGVEETQPEETLLEQAIKEAVTLLKEIKKLKTSVEVRAGPPRACGPSAMRGAPRRHVGRLPSPRGTYTPVTPVASLRFRGV
jgi:hypothetical protein